VYGIKSEREVGDLQRGKLHLALVNLKPRQGAHKARRRRELLFVKDAFKG
jgi:hypothetical protein